MNNIFEKGMVSIIIPVYGAEDFLDRCLVSVSSQTYENLEIILIDDGSPDNSGKICDSWAKKDSRIRVIHQANGGASKARNSGYKIMRGEFVISIDSDDIITFNTIEYLIDSINSTNADAAICKIGYVFNENKLESKKYNSKKLKYFIKENQEIHETIFFKMDYQTYCCNKLYRTSKVKNIYLREDLISYEDMEIVPRLLKQCSKVVFLKNTLYYYYIRLNSLSHDASRVEVRLEQLMNTCLLNQKRYQEWFPSIGKKFNNYITLEYLLFNFDIFTKIPRKNKNKIILNSKYLSIYLNNHKGFLTSSYKFYYKLLYISFNIKLLFFKY